MTRIEFTADAYELSVLARALRRHAESGVVDYSRQETITAEERVVARTLAERIARSAVMAMEQERVVEMMMPWRN